MNILKYYINITLILTNKSNLNSSIRNLKIKCNSYI